MARISLLPNTPFGRNAVMALGKSLEKMGHEVFDFTRDDKSPVFHEIAVVCGTVKRASPHQIVLEAGYFLREGVPPDRVLYSVNYQRILDMPARINSRGIARFARLKDRYRPILPSFEQQAQTTDKILVLGQVPRDHSHPFQTIDQLLEWFYEKLPHGRQIVFRPHPLTQTPPLPPTWKLDQCGTIQQSLAIHRPDKVYTYSSTAGLWALCDGWDVNCAESAWYHGKTPIEAGTLAAQSTFTERELEDGTAIEYLVRHCEEKHRVLLPI
jgi:hypothetical protein